MPVVFTLSAYFFFFFSYEKVWQREWQNEHEAWKQVLNPLRIKTQHIKKLQRVIVVNIAAHLSTYTTHTLKPFKEQGLISQRIKKLASKLHVHSVNFAAKLVHTRRALFSTVINSHQEPFSGQACKPPNPHWFSLSFLRWRSITVLVTKVAPFL